jgi:hypothetical protein
VRKNRRGALGFGKGEWMTLAIAKPRVRRIGLKCNSINQDIARYQTVQSVYLTRLAGPRGGRVCKTRQRGASQIPGSWDPRLGACTDPIKNRNILQIGWLHLHSVWSPRAVFSTKPFATVVSGQLEEL